MKENKHIEDVFFVKKDVDYWFLRSKKIKDHRIVTNHLNDPLEKQKQNELIQGLVKDVLYNSLAQAILTIIKTPHKILKYFLLIYVLASASIGSYFVIDSIMIYFNYEVFTTVKTIFEEPAAFPTITICNCKSKLQKFHEFNVAVIRPFFRL